jgi:hypothetical protein
VLRRRGESFVLFQDRKIERKVQDSILIVGYESNENENENENENKQNQFMVEIVRNYLDKFSSPFVAGIFLSTRLIQVLRSEAGSFYLFYIIC